jgi:phage terminase large subunit-like protein
LFRNGLIFHRRDMDKLEKQLKEFPRWKHDDVIDATQMLYDLYTLQPNTVQNYSVPQIKYDSNGRPIFN